MTDEGRVPSHGAGVLHDFKRGGYDPRRHIGAKSFSRKLLANVNELARSDDDGETAQYSLPDLARLAENPNVDHARATAAGILCYVRKTGWDTIARQPKMLSTLAWLFDRQLGKPQQSVKIETQAVPPPDVAWRSLIDALGDLPADLRGDLRAALDGQLGAPKPVENTALARAPKAVPQLRPSPPKGASSST